MKRVFDQGRYANVTATMALVVALGGTAYAANTVRSRDIVNGQVKHVDLAKDAVTSAKVKGGTLLRGDFKSGELPAGARGPAGSKGDSGAPGAKGDKGDPGTSVFAATIPSGQTISGVMGGNAPATAAGANVNMVVSFPVPAPAPVLAGNVNFAPAPVPFDDDPTCSGTAAAPTAPRGQVCLYLVTASNANDAAGYQIGAAAESTRGFSVGWSVEQAGGESELRAVWAYTAP